MQYKSIDIILSKQNLNHKKWLIYAIAAVTLFVDAMLTVSVIASGVGGGQWVCLTLMTVLDAILMPVIANSNFRFKYSRVLPILHTLASTVLVIVATAVGAGLFTSGAATFFVLLHLLALVAFLLAVFAGGGYGTAMRVITYVVAALMAVLSLIYFIVFCVNGYHGQNTGGSRLLHYTYDHERGGYTVTGVMGGSSDTVVVPDTFDGSPVKAVDCAIFADGGVKSVYVLCGEDVTFLTNDALRETEASIYFPKQQMDALKEKQIEAFKVERNDLYLNVCNMIQPSNMKSNEVYISFNYTADALRYMDYQLIPTWFGNKGDTFSLADYAAKLAAEREIYLPFAEDYDINSEAFLYDSYLNNQKVLCPLANGNRVIDRTAINESVSHLLVSFETVYSVSIADDNDGRYEIDTSEKSFRGSGYRYVLGSDHLDLLGNFRKRLGFDLTWKYTANGKEKADVESLSALLGKYEGLCLYPEWVLRAPEILSDATRTDHVNDKMNYGEDVVFSAAATEPAPGIQMVYSWTYKGETKNAFGTTGFTMLNVKPQQSGEYELTVTAGNDSNTTLTSSSTYRISLEVRRLPVSLQWHLPSGSDLVYNAQSKAFSCVHLSADLINGDVIYSDDIAYHITRNGEAVNSMLHAGDYTVTAEIVGEMGEYYYIPTADSSVHTDAVEYVTIERKTVTAAWSQSSFVYTAVAQGPEIVALSGVCSGDSHSDVLSSIRYGAWERDAGRHELTVSLPDTADYKLSQSSYSYTITPVVIPLSTGNWTTASSFVYNGQAQYPTVASLPGGYVKGDDRAADILAAILYSEKPKNVGSDYTVVATLPENYNYTFSDTVSKGFDITAKPLSFTWSGTDLIYNGTMQCPVPVAQGVVSGDTVNLEWRGAEKDAGNYTATVISTGNSNYQIGTNAAFSYVIKPRTVTAVWGQTSLVYDGTMQAPVIVDLENAIAAEKSALLAGISVVGAKTDAGSEYRASAVIGNGNYVFDTANPACTFGIAKRGVNLIWSTNTSFTYNGAVQSPTVTGVSNVATGDTASAILATVLYSNRGTNAGDHKVIASLNHNNYTVAENAQRSYTISPKTLTPTWQNVSLSYNGSAQYPRITALSGMVGSDTGTALLNGISYSNYGVNAGTHTVKATLTNGNYTLSISERAYTIAKKSISITWDTTTSLKYDGNVKYYGGTTNGYDQYVRFTYWQNGVEVQAPVAVGSYKVQAQVSNSNFVLSGTTSKTFYIVN